MNQIIAQLRDLFESMTPAARITSGLLLVVAVVSLAFLFQSSTSSPDAFLFGGHEFSQTEINHMEAAMANANLSGWKVEGNRVRVPSSIQTEAIAAIASGGALPRGFSSFMDEALTKSSALESRPQFELRTKTARENQLSKIINHFNWVEQAQVMLDLGSRRGGLNPKNSASASVYVEPKPGESIDQSRARSLKNLVAGALSSLTVDNVLITGESDFSDLYFEDRYLREREAIQKSYKSRILAGLSYIPGVRVEVSATLNNQVSQRKVESTPNEAKLQRSVTESEREDSQVNDIGGRPGYDAQGPGRSGLDEDLNRQNSTTIARETTDEVNQVGVTTVEEFFEGFKPDEMYASIAIPVDYVLEVWQQKNPASDPSEITDTEMQTMQNDLKQRVERWVQNILPRLSLGEDEYRQVEVVYFESIKQQPLPSPSLADNALAWTSRSWGTLSMLGLAAVSLLMLRSSLKPTGTPDSNAGALELDFASQSANAEQTSEEDAEKKRPKLKIKKSESLKEDLSEMVRDDPDSAANILRAWIHNAG